MPGRSGLVPPASNERDGLAFLTSSSGVSISRTRRRKKEPSESRVSSIPGRRQSDLTRSSGTLKIEGAKVHPTVFITPADVRRARRNIERYDWARQIADAVLREAAEWLKREDDWLRRTVPLPGASFAVGISGCPICGANWGPWARDGASFENPGHVTCPNGHTLPDNDHPDEGNGYRGPDGRNHYFVGTYNSWVVETLTFKALENLVYAYTLTADERYADKAIVILDAIASIYEETP